MNLHTISVLYQKEPGMTLHTASTKGGLLWGGERP